MFERDMAQTYGIEGVNDGDNRKYHLLMMGSPRNNSGGVDRGKIYVRLLTVPSNFPIASQRLLLLTKRDYEFIRDDPEPESDPELDLDKLSEGDGRRLRTYDPKKLEDDIL